MQKKSEFEARDSKLGVSNFIKPRLSNGKIQFLDTGYYFWDKNLELSKVCGNHRYS